MTDTLMQIRLASIAIGVFVCLSIISLWNHRTQEFVVEAAVAAGLWYATGKLEDHLLQKETR